MTDVQHRAAAATIRAYRPTDHSACRGLWAELMHHREELYGRPAARSTARTLDGGERESRADLGAGFEEYLTRLDLSGLWVAVPTAGDPSDGEVVGFVGLVLDGDCGEVDPVVVAATERGHGIGRALLTKVAEEARRRGLSRLTISPPIRDVPALRSLRGAGFDTVANVTLAIDIGASSDPSSSLELYDLRFAV
jgi:GNAT superfamily N-acetyltransferase